MRCPVLTRPVPLPEILGTVAIVRQRAFCRQVTLADTLAAYARGMRCPALTSRVVAGGFRRALKMIMEAHAPGALSSTAKLRPKQPPSWYKLLEVCGYL
eukprot:2167840-Rhodomonas_salina.2